VDPFEILDLSRAEFERRLRAVTEDQWHLPTPCADWDVRQLVAHVVGGNDMSVALLHGATREEATATLAVDGLGDDAVAALARSAALQEAAFREEGAFERPIPHPSGDLISGFDLFGFRVADYVLHGWDLARATGGDEILHPDLVVLVHDGMKSMESDLVNTGYFGTGSSGALAAEADVQRRLLDLSGRRP
jgi:uncharacterized protein (TIGR03086 family)